MWGGCWVGQISAVVVGPFASTALGVVLWLGLSPGSAPAGCSGGVEGPGAVGVGESEFGESGEVGRGGEEGEVGGDA
jgi:hypothetical protein